MQAISDSTGLRADDPYWFSEDGLSNITAMDVRVVPLVPGARKPLWQYLSLSPSR